MVSRRAAFVVTLVVGILSSTAAFAGLSWSHTVRDVYLDGTAEPEAQVFRASAPSRLLVLSNSLDRAVMVDLEARTLATLNKKSVRLSADGAIATTPHAGKALSGTASRVNGADYLSWPKHSLLIAPHVGLVGETTAEDLWRAAPVWQALGEGYAPDAEAVERLRTVSEPTTVTVAFGTWCGDSKRHVPALLASLDAAENPNLEVRLVGLERGFDGPLDFIRDQRLTNVPTMIVQRQGKELGRIVETPAMANVESDLAAILDQQPPVHDGRWDRGEQIASGRYLILDSAGQKLGEESWRMWHTEEGGRLLHSVLQHQASTLEVWQEESPSGETTFVEITRQREGRHSRTRHWLEDGQLSSTTRGSDTGIVRQIIELPAGTRLMTPTVLGAGSTWQGRDSAATDSAVFHLGGTQRSTGFLETLQCEVSSQAPVDTPAGSFSGQQVDFDGSLGSSRCWLDAELGIPLSGQVAGLGEIVLEEFHRSGP